MPDKDTRTSFSKEDLLAMTRGELFTPESPRFPRDHMMMVDRIREINDHGGNHQSGIVVGELDINPDLWFFDCHFPSDPVMPGCLGLDAMWQLAGFYLAWHGHQGVCRALGVGSVRFGGQVLPESRLIEYYINIKRKRSKPFPQVFANAFMHVDGTEVYGAQNLHIGVFPKTTPT